MIKHALAVVAMLATPAVAAAASKYTTTQLCQILQPCEPPAEYASGPFVAKPVIRKVGLRQIQAICGGDRIGSVGGAGDLPSVMGCASIQNGICLVHVPADVMEALRFAGTRD